eukprot:scaffold18338_cov122-Isochrysis_galbana.AAC.3
MRGGQSGDEHRGSCARLSAPAHGAICHDHDEMTIARVTGPGTGIGTCHATGRKARACRGPAACRRKPQVASGLQVRPHRAKDRAPPMTDDPCISDVVVALMSCAPAVWRYALRAKMGKGKKCKGATCRTSAGASPGTCVASGTGAGTPPPPLPAANANAKGKRTTPRARGGVTMEPLQLRLEPTEVVLATDKGAARARVDSIDESSPQVLICARALPGCSPGACTAHCWRYMPVYCQSQSSGSGSWHGL